MPIKHLHAQRAYPAPDDHRLALVLAELDHATFQPFVVWTYNVQTGSMAYGDYYADLSTALKGFAARYRRLTARTHST